LFSFFRKSAALTPNLQLKELKKYGIAPRPGLKKPDFLKFREQAYVEKPYLLLLIALGGTTSRLGPVSDRIWHVHRTSILRSGDYAAVANRMSGLSQGALPLEQVMDMLLPDEDAAKLQFLLNGEAYEWRFPWNGSDLDSACLTSLARLLQENSDGRQFAFFKLGGNDALIGCFTPTERDGLEKLTGLHFLWLSENALIL
jgi:hypothetical protein